MNGEILAVLPAYNEEVSIGSISTMISLRF